jgi:hypothetical protein
MRSLGQSLRRVPWQRVAWIAYFVLPDPVPGPVDDLILMVLMEGWLVAKQNKKPRRNP